MATFEENILGYLDGSLDSDARNEILHALSVSPEKRALLDAHLRLTDLLTVVQKPISAPLSVQRELASKVPVLAAKLPYLAPPSERRGGVSGFFTRASKSIHPSSINTILILALALVLGGVWFVVSTSHDNFSASKGNSNISSVPTPRNGVSPGNPLRNSTPPSSNNGTSNSLEGTSLNGNMSGIASEKATTASSRIAGRAALNILKVSRVNGNGVGANAGSNISNSSPISIPSTDQNTPSTQPPVADIPSITISQPSAAHSLRVNDNRPLRGVTFSDEEDYSPLHFFAVTQSRNTFVPNVPLTPYVMNNNIGVTTRLLSTVNPEFGIDYEISPWVSVGLRGGYASFVQMQPFLFSDRVSGYPYLNQHTTDAMLSSMSALWSGIALSYAFNPEGQWHLGASIVGGNAFLGSVTPMGMFELNGGYELSSTMLLRGAISIDVSRIQPGQSPQPVVGNNAIFGIVNQGPNVVPLTSTALSVSIGIAYHP